MRRIGYYQAPPTLLGELMKSLVIAFAATLIPALASAQASDEVDAFLKSTVVQSEQAKVVADGKVLDENPTSALLGGGCGFAGCQSVYLVTIGYSTKGTNPQTSVIAATVRISTYGQPVVQLTTIKALVN